MLRGRPGPHAAPRPSGCIGDDCGGSGSRHAQGSGDEIARHTQPGRGSCASRERRCSSSGRVGVSGCQAGAGGAIENAKEIGCASALAPEFPASSLTRRTPMQEYGERHAAFPIAIGCTADRPLMARCSHRFRPSRSRSRSTAPTRNPTPGRSPWARVAPRTPPFALANASSAPGGRSSAATGNAGRIGVDVEDERRVVLQLLSGGRPPRVGRREAGRRDPVGLERTHPRGEDARRRVRDDGLVVQGRNACRVGADVPSSRPRASLAFQSSASASDSPPSSAIPRSRRGRRGAAPMAARRATTRPCRSDAGAITPGQRAHAGMRTRAFHVEPLAVLVYAVPLAYRAPAPTNGRGASPPRAPTHRGSCRETKSASVFAAAPRAAMASISAPTAQSTSASASPNGAARGR